LLKTKKTELL